VVNSFVLEWHAKANEMKYPNASTEPLSVIEAHVCNDDRSLSTSRFERLFNEIEKLRADMDAMRSALGPPE
jgi:hypothetical protein